MPATKTKLCVSVSAPLAQFLEEYAQSLHVSKSAVVERSLKQMVEQRMIEDSKATAAMTFDDLPTEDEWLMIQPKW